MAFPTTSVLDNFTGTNGDDLPVYSANWQATTTGGAALEIQGNAATGTSAGGNNTNSWATSYGPDCEVYVTISTVAAAGNVILLFARGVQTTSLSTVDGYVLRYAPAAGTDTLTIQSVTNGVQTSIGAAFSQEIANGDSIGLECVGTTLTCYYKPSGGSWGSLFSRTDSTYTAAGQVALFSTSTGVRFDAFGGGTFVNNGTASITTGSDTSSASGTTTIKGSSSVTTANDTSSASGNTTILATANITTANDTSSASGSVGGSVDGTANITTQNDTVSASGTTTVTGSTSVTTGNDLSSSSGSTTVIGTVSITSGNDIATANGYAGSITGTANITTGNDTCVAYADSGIATTTPQFGGGLSSSRSKRYYIERDGKRIFFTDESQVYDLLHQEEKRVVKKAKKAIKRVTKAELAELVTFKDLEIPTPKIVMHFNDVAINNSIDKINQRIHENYIKALMRHVEEMEEEDLFLELLFH